VGAWPPQGHITCDNAGIGFPHFFFAKARAASLSRGFCFASVCGHCRVPCSGGGSSSSISTSSSSSSLRCECATAHLQRRSRHIMASSHKRRRTPSRRRPTKNTASAWPCCYIHGGHSPTSALRPCLIFVLPTKARPSGPRAKGHWNGGVAGWGAVRSVVRCPRRAPQTRPPAGRLQQISASWQGLALTLYPDSSFSSIHQRRISGPST
jgi:hypothetical protein